MRKVLVDADGCPAREVIIEVARQHNVPVCLVASVKHRLQPEEGVEILQVDSSFQAADMAIANRVSPGDVVVTQDLGLAALIIAKGGSVLSPRGRFILSKDLDYLLEERHLFSKIRRGGGRTPGPAAFSLDDRERLRKTLEGLLEGILPDRGEDG